MVGAFIAELPEVEKRFFKGSEPQRGTTAACAQNGLSAAFEKTASGSVGGRVRGRAARQAEAAAVPRHPRVGWDDDFMNPPRKCLSDFALIHAKDAWGYAR